MFTVSRENTVLTVKDYGVSPKTFQTLKVVRRKVIVKPHSLLELSILICFWKIGKKITLKL